MIGTARDDVSVKVPATKQLLPVNVVFDFGAVLFTWQPKVLVAQHFPQAAATTEQAATLAHLIFGHADWHSFDRGTLTVHEVTARTATRLGLDAVTLFELVQGIAQHLQPITDTVALLRTLHERRGVAVKNDQSQPALRLYFLSNMPKPYARALEAKHAFLQWFDGGVFSGDVKFIKPELAIFELLQSRYALEPAATVFIDDLKANVGAAQSLGWQGIQFESAQQLQSQLAALGL